MKSAQLDGNQNLILKYPILLGIVGFLSWMLIFLLFDPLAGLYKIGKFDIDLSLLSELQLYFQSLFVGFIFFLFFYLTLKYKQKFIMWLGIVLYALFYLGYLFLLFFFRFTDL